MQFKNTFEHAWFKNTCHCMYKDNGVLICSTLISVMCGLRSYAGILSFNLTGNKKINAIFKTSSVLCPER
jgi:hypothetical protein